MRGICNRKRRRAAARAIRSAAKRMCLAIPVSTSFLHEPQREARAFVVLGHLRLLEASDVVLRHALRVFGILRLRTSVDPTRHTTRVERRAGRIIRVSWGDARRVPGKALTCLAGLPLVTG
jgi:hypothetical protein